MNSSLTPLLWFGAIVVLIPLALWLLKRTPIGSGAGSGPLRHVAMLPLSASQRVTVVELRYGNTARWLVLGVSAGRIDALATLDAPPEVPRYVAQPQAGTVDQLIARWRGGAQL